MQPWRLSRAVSGLAAVALLGASAAALLPASPVSAAGEPVSCLPTCDETDSRMLSLPGAGLQSLSGPTISVFVTVADPATTLDLGIFDGDTGGLWDAGTTDVEYSLYADPVKSGGGVLIDQWLGNGDAMPNNDWFEVSVPVSADAADGSGRYVYRLDAALTVPAEVVVSSFKVRANGEVAIASSQVFAYFASMSPIAAAGPIIYPDCVGVTPLGSCTELATTTYDGTWTFPFVVDPDENGNLFEVEMWDGDFDYGSSDGSTLDTDDPDTPGAPFVPDFAGVGSAVPESATDARPFDDNLIRVEFVRSPSVQYSLVGPDGTVWDNLNPSGNSEWERFAVRSSSHPDGCTVGVDADYCVDSLLPGTYRIEATGVDLSNLNAFYLDYEVYSSTGPLLASLGDFVWWDLDLDGVQDDTEPPVEGVTVNLIGPGADQEFGTADDVVIASSATEAAGWYQFVTYPGVYVVEFVSDRGFTVPNAGSDPALDSDADPVSGRSEPVTLEAGQHDSTIDAGLVPYAVGDFVWLDADADGVQDAGEVGIAGVVVELLNGDGVMFGSATTDADGSYLFEGLMPGEYTVVVSGSNFATGGVLAGMEPTVDYGTEGNQDGQENAGSQTVVDCRGPDLMCSDIIGGSTAIYTAQDLDASDPDAIAWQVDVVVELGGSFGTTDSASTFRATRED